MSSILYKTLTITRANIKFLPESKKLTITQFENFKQYEREFQELVLGQLNPSSEDKYVSTLTSIYDNLSKNNKYLTAFSYYYEGCGCGKDECNTPSGKIYVMLTKDYTVEENDLDTNNRYICSHNTIEDELGTSSNINNLIVYSQVYNENDNTNTEAYEIHKDYKTVDVQIEIV